MAARSSSSSDNALDLSNDGPSKVMREAERSSLIQLSNSQKDPERGSSEEEGSSLRRNSLKQEIEAIIKVASNHQSRSTEAERPSYQNEKGKAIMRGLGDFNELVPGRVGTSENLEAETRVVETSFVCACCYWEYQNENMVQCRDGHPFCFECIRRRVDEIIYGVLRAHANGSLSCMDIYHCKQSILLPEIRKVIPNDVLEKFEYRVAQAIVEEAHIENLVHCPFCNIPYEIDKCVQVLDCPNPKCLKSSCIQCKKVSHLPLRCEEVDKNSAETTLRRKVEERMANAVIRKCNICEVELIKEYGCNSLTCRCGNTMCYLCRKTLSDVGSYHFCMCITLPDRREEGKFCPRCNKCSRFYEPGDDEALAAKEEALKELVVKNPELLDLAIGPPLITQTQQLLTTCFLRSRTRHPPELNAHGDQLANMHAPPPLAPSHFLRDRDRLGRMPLNPTLPAEDFFRFGNGGQFSNMVVPESLPPLLFVRNGNVGQLENMGVPAPLPAQHFFRYGNGGQFSNMAVPAPSTPYLTLPSQEFLGYGNCGQPANIAVRPPLPPPHFVRYGNGGQRANMAVRPPLPPPHFVRYGNGGQRANMAVPAPLPPEHFIRYGNGGQPANMVAAAPLPPQHFVRYGNGGQLANMATPDLGALLPPQHFFRYVNGGYPANMAVPAPLSQEHFFRYGNGGRYANRNLPEQQDYGSRLQRPSDYGGQ